MTTHQQTTYASMLARMYRDARIHALEVSKLDEKHINRPMVLRALGHYLDATCHMLTHYIAECHGLHDPASAVEQLRRDACGLATVQHRMINHDGYVDTPENLRGLAEMFGEKALFWRELAGLNETDLELAA